MLYISSIDYAIIGIHDGVAMTVTIITRLPYTDPFLYI